MSVAPKTPAIDTPLPLLLEPEEPPPVVRRWAGWRFRDDTREPYVREHRDDERGAWAQWVIARYVLTDITRAELATENGMCVRGVQNVLSAKVWQAYTQPILRAFERLGIGTSRGRWTDEAPRPREIVVASRVVMARAAEALAGRPISAEDRDRLLADLRLLSAVAAFEPWRS